MFKFKNGLIISYNSGNLLIKDVEEAFSFYCINTAKIDYLEYSNKFGTRNLEKEILDIIERNKVEIVLLLQPVPIAIIDPHFLEKISLKSKLLICPWDIEIYFESLDRYYAQCADLVLVVASKLYTYMLKLYGIESIWISSIYNSNYYKNKFQNRDIDVVFIGDICKSNRKEYIDYLLNNGINIQTYGINTTNGFVTNEKMIELYNRSKITLNFCNNDSGVLIPNLKNITRKIPQLKGRISEALLCGSLVLDEQNLIDERYIQGEHLDNFSSKKELLEKIKIYLNDTNKRDKISIAGYKYALDNYDNINAFEKVVDKLINLDKRSKEIILDKEFTLLYTTQHFYMFLNFLLNKQFLYAKDEFKILLKNKFKISFSKVTFLYIKEILLTVVERFMIINQLNRKLKNANVKKIIIYAGGTHTKQLIPVLSEEILQKIIYIYDQNSFLNGSKINGIEISSSKNIFEQSDTILISSLAFEREIVSILDKEFPKHNVIKIYNNKSRNIFLNWYEKLFKLLYWN